MQIGICDDQDDMRSLLIEKVKEVYPMGNIMPFACGQEVLDAPQLPDILFLDIQMPGLNWMETARKIRKRDLHRILIFVTVSEDYVFQTFDVGAFHYLVKPFSVGKFAEVLQKAIRQVAERQKELTAAQAKPPSIMVTAKGKHITINLEDIVYAEVFDRKIIIHTMDADIEYYGKMKELQKHVGEGFYRPHRAFLVNFNYIEKYDAKTIYLKKGQALMAKQNYQDFVKSYIKYIRSISKQYGQEGW